LEPAREGLKSARPLGDRTEEGPPNGASRSVSKPNERLSVSTPAASADRTRRLAPAPRGSSGPPRRPRTRKGKMTAVALWVVFGGLSGLFAVIAFLIAIRATQAPVLRIEEWLTAIAFIAPIGAAIVAIFWYSRRLGGAIRELEEGAESTARLAAIVESSQEAIIGKTLDGRITTWNAGAERMYGFTAAEAIGKPVSMIVPKTGLVELDQILARLRRGESSGRFGTAGLRKDGRTSGTAV